MLVYDVTNRATFDALDQWLDEMKLEVGSGAGMDNIVFVLCANKVRLLSFFFILFPLLCAVDVPCSPCSTVVHSLPPPRQSSLCPTIFSWAFHSSFSLVLSFPLPSFLRRAPLFSHLQPPFLDFLCDFPLFRYPLILSFLILSSFVALHIHRSIRIHFCDLQF